MTKEEAARIIKECEEKGFKHTFYTLNEWQAALDMALQELEQEPCEDAISRQDMEEIINDVRDCISCDGYWAIIERMKKLPPVQPKQRTGKWEIDESIQKAFGDDAYVCTVCSTIWNSSNIKNMHYCPTCGAKMEGEE